MSVEVANQRDLGSVVQDLVVLPPHVRRERLVGITPVRVGAQPGAVVVGLVDREQGQSPVGCGIPESLDGTGRIPEGFVRRPIERVVAVEVIRAPDQRL